MLGKSWPASYVVNKHLMSPLSAANMFYSLKALIDFNGETSKVYITEKLLAKTIL